GVWWEEARGGRALKLDASGEGFAALDADDGAGSLAAEMGFDEFRDAEKLEAIHGKQDLNNTGLAAPCGPRSMIRIRRPLSFIVSDDPTQTRRCTGAEKIARILEYLCLGFKGLDADYVTATLRTIDPSHPVQLRPGRNAELLSRCVPERISMLVDGKEATGGDTLPYSQL
ncbi:hypothetical protein O988_06945, partial [Pseudogymnoascus sp. VKM F-3808]